MAGFLPDNEVSIEEKKKKKKKNEKIYVEYDDLFDHEMDYYDLVDDVDDDDYEILPVDLAKKRSSFQDLPPDVQRAYQLALEQGSRPSHATRLILVGHYGAGKTSLKRCLLNKPFLSHYEITNGIDVDPTTCRVDIEKATNWRYIEGEDKKDDSYEDEMLKVVSQLVHKQQAECEGPQRSESPTTSGTETGIERKGNVGQPAGDQPLIKPNWVLLRKLRDVKSDYATHHKVPEDELSIWDFAGQSTYYASHQLFLTHRAIYLVVLDIMQALDSPINTDQLGFKETAQNGISSQTIIDQLDYWLNSIYSHTTTHRTDTRLTSIIIVLTHKDKLQQKYPSTVGQKFRDYRRAIIKHIVTKVYFDHVHLEFFGIANNVPDDPEIDRLRGTIMDLARSQPYWEQEIPLKWIALRDGLKEKKTSTAHITFEQAQQICKEDTVRISSRTELCHALTFYHELGEFVFFNENNIRNHIILDPQWLIDAISKVITIPRFYQTSESPQSAQMWKFLEHYGVLTETILTDVWDKEVKNHLTNLMYKFRLMLPMRVCNMTEVYKMVDLEMQEDGAFLVPSLLPLLKNPESRMTTGPLPATPEVLVIFRDGFIPVGITSHLISGLVMNEAWVLTGKVYQNHATFLPEGQNTNLSITIHQQADCLHLQGHILDDKPTRPNCLRPYLFVLLEQLGFVMRSSCPRSTFEMAIECKCDHAGRHIVKIGATGEGIDGSSSLYCPEHQARFSTMTYSYWFKVESSKKNLNKTPDQANLNEQTLLKVAHQIGSKWQDLGYHLVDSRTVDNLCTPLDGGPGLYGLRMLLRWHQGLDCTSISSMKDQLIGALEGREDLLQLIKEYNAPNEQELFHKLSRGLTKIWREVGKKLGVDADDMDAIDTPQMPDYNPGLRMLVTWRDQGGCRTELIDKLKKLKHHAIAQSLELGEI